MMMMTTWRMRTLFTRRAVLVKTAIVMMMMMTTTTMMIRMIMMMRLNQFTVQTIRAAIRLSPTTLRTTSRPTMTEACILKTWVTELVFGITQDPV